jgi:hypothetical protein
VPPGPRREKRRMLKLRLGREGVCRSLLEAGRDHEMYACGWRGRREVQRLM